MRSSSGQHFVAIDHLRAFAAFLVFAWHFLHFSNGYPVPFGGAPVIFPLALLDEGHTGVALFMVLSGYLFAKLLDGKSIDYPAFFWNRFIRLAPLLVITFVLAGIEHRLNGGNSDEYIRNIFRGFVYPTWPNGGWSVATEIHFYITLPLLLIISKHSKALPVLIILAAIAFRVYFFKTHGEVQSIAYWTIMGRIDQFTLGILAFFYSASLLKKPRLIALIFLAFMAFWWWFDVSGGFYLQPKYPSSNPVWVFIPTIEGIAYAVLIAWYDSKNVSTTSITSKIAQRLGEYSYSIYLLHTFVVFRCADYIQKNIMDISNFYVSLVWALGLFVVMLVPGYLSFRFIESPFLKFRLRYTQ